MKKKVRQYSASSVAWNEGVFIHQYLAENTVFVARQDIYIIYANVRRLFGDEVEDNAMIYSALNV